MAGAFAATDFVASKPGTPTLFLEKESEEGKSGRDLAVTRFKNRLRFAQEGALIGGGFSVMGKPLAVGLKYGICLNQVPMLLVWVLKQRTKLLYHHCHLY